MLHTVVLLGLAAAAFASPLRVQHEEDVWLYSGKFEGDMILNADQMSNLHSKNGIMGSQYLWPNKTVVYVLSPDFVNGEDVYLAASEKAAILNGIQYFESRTCIRFREKTASDTAYVNVTRHAKGCYSEVGYNGRSQKLNLYRGCFYNTAIIHEFLHALGFYHQQSATERDDYVTIVWNNIIPGKEENFRKHKTNNFGVPYDYGSVMHYSSKAFGVNGKTTIIPKDPKAKIGQRMGFSDADIQKLHLMYDCA